MTRNHLQLVLERTDLRGWAIGVASEDSYCLTPEDGGFAVFFQERGSRFQERRFDDEDEACVYLLLWLLKVQPTPPPGQGG